MSDLLLWLAVALMILTAAGRRRSFAPLAGCAGWSLFAVFWVSLLPAYARVSDYTNSLLAVAAAVLCLIAAGSFFGPSRVKEAGKDPASAPETIPEPIFDLTVIVVVICILYFPFRMIEPVGSALIAAVTKETADVLLLLGCEAVRIAPDVISYNGYLIRVILACTAIESIAVVSGLIIAVRAPPVKKVIALIAVIPTIYLLNILRNVFVIAAYGDMWFGPDSFLIAHNYVAKAGSIAALILIACLLFRYIPELREMIAQIYEFLISKIRGAAGLNRPEK